MKEDRPGAVHRVLATSYLAYFLFCSLGLFLGLFLPVNFFVSHNSFWAIICFVVGPLFIFWAQVTSYKFEVIKKKTGQLAFKRGPYRILRNPTQLGLLILVLGYAFATQTAILFLSTATAYIISNVFFRKHESILESRYGDSYKSYKASVKKVL